MSQLRSLVAALSPRRLAPKGAPAPAPSEPSNSKRRDDKAPKATPGPASKLAPASTSRPISTARRVPDGSVDPVLAAVVTALIGFGVIMVYSASAIEATVRYHDAQFLLKRQAVYAVLAVVAMWITARIDYRRLRPFTYPILVSVVVMLALTVFGFGHKAGNAYRWLNVGPVHIQPAELAKLAVVVWLSHSLSKKAELVKTFSIGFLPHLLVVGGLALLLLKQPDFGSAVVLTFLTFTLLFVAGARTWYIASFTAFLAVAAVGLVRFSSYRYARYLAWMDMEGNRNGLAYQPFQSVMSFGSGGSTGLGLGRGLQVLYLPEAHTDFVSAIVGEEFGFVGICALGLAYLTIVARGVRTALAADDDYGSFLAFGIATLFGVQALTNLAVAMSILPTKGLTLPFLSYGGSSLLVNGAAAGILLSISRPWREVAEKKPKRAAEPLSAAPNAGLLVATSAEEGA